MATFSGHLLAIRDFLAFFGSHDHGVDSLKAHHVEIVVRTLIERSEIEVKGHAVELPEPHLVPGPQKIYFPPTRNPSWQPVSMLPSVHLSMVYRSP